MTVKLDNTSTFFEGPALSPERPLKVWVEKTMTIHPTDGSPPTVRKWRELVDLPRAEDQPRISPGVKQ